MHNLLVIFKFIFIVYIGDYAAFWQSKENSKLGFITWAQVSLARRLIDEGVQRALVELPEGETHICRVWYADTGHEYSAKLKGALEGAERQALWDELAAFLGPPEEGKEGEGEGKEGEEGGKKDGE